MNQRWSAQSITTAGAFVALTAIGANITSIAPFMMVGGVPITLQTFFAVLAGIVLGSRLGAFTMFVYMLLGLVGAPIFAQFKGGAAILLSPTFGFIVSFILVAYVTGKLVEKKKSLPMYVTAAVVGMAINYIFGTNWMYAAYLFWFDAPSGFTYGVAWAWMAVPLPKDIILSVVAGVFAYRIEKIGIGVQKVQKKQRAA
ncbi:BioY family transporter [Lentibacillus populi]|uniref:Biotin transporter n=1 Tax=Lentibacillus populi TaxID=1827502 RepID=A0A9W5X752_9BACI|nr:MULTISPECIES: biotin transporter BioY [Bacillaceae]GGB58313.1 BioY family transporter [Lentibacillus populi]